MKGVSRIRELVRKGDNGVVLVVVDSYEYSKANVRILKELVDAGLEGVYVTVNLPYSSLKKRLLEEGVDVSRIFFIDMITRASGVPAGQEEDCIFISNPSGLTDLGIALSEVLPGKDFLFLDSLSTLTISNEARTVERFSQFLTARVRAYGVKTVLLSLKRREDEEVIRTVSQFADAVITVGG